MATSCIVRDCGLMMSLFAWKGKRKILFQALAALKKIILKVFFYTGMLIWVCLPYYMVHAYCCSLQFRYGETWTPIRGESTNIPALIYDEVYLGSLEFIKSVWSFSADIVDIIEFHNQTGIRMVPRFHSNGAAQVTQKALLYVSGIHGNWLGEKLFCTLTLHHL